MGGSVSGRETGRAGGARACDTGEPLPTRFARVRLAWRAP